jgi:hypothetical protein
VGKKAAQLPSKLHRRLVAGAKMLCEKSKSLHLSVEDGIEFIVKFPLKRIKNFSLDFWLSVSLAGKSFTLAS